jgi:hypothetical protein
VHAHILHQACKHNSNGYFVSRVCTGHGRSHASLVDPDLTWFCSAWMDLSSAHYSDHSHWTWEAQEWHDTIA